MAPPPAAWFAPLFLFAAAGGLYRARTGRPAEGAQGAAAWLDERRTADAQRLRSFAEASSDWFWEQDGAFRFTYVTDSPLRSRGHSSASYLGKTRLEANPGAVAETSWEALEAEQAARRPFRDFRYSFLRANGELEHISISGVPVFGQDGAFKGYRGTGRLITPEIEAREQVSQAEARLAIAIDAFPAEFALFDAAGKLVSCNYRFRYAMLRTMGEEPPVGSLFLERARELAYGGTGFENREFLSDRSQRFERHLPDGGWTQVEERRTGDGGVMLVITDISKQKAREAELRSAKEAAERAALLKTQFLATVSHELRTPLNAIIGFTEVMQQELFGPLGHERYRSYLEHVLESGRHLRQIIDDILDVTRIESGSLSLAAAPVELESLLEQCASAIATAAEQAGLSLSLTNAAGRISLIGDATKLRQVLRNLLVNAVTFTEPGGRIEIGCERLPAGGVAIRVADTGIGMSAEEIRLALTPFGQVSNPMTRRHQGLGLGLTLAKSLTELHGGRLEVESAVGAGTTVRVVLPADRIMV
jgi:PAS domain S-box-containing protein